MRHFSILIKIELAMLLLKTAFSLQIMSAKCTLLVEAEMLLETKDKKTMRLENVTM